MLRELNCECAHTTRARLDQNFLPFLQLRLFDERLPSGQADQRDGSRFLHREALGFNCQVIFAYCDELRECPDSVLVRSCIHLVAGLESPHARSHSDYDSCQLVTENERQSIRQQQFEFSVSDLGIQWVHTSSVDLNQDVILPHFRVWNFAGPHAICASIAIDDECLHDALRHLPDFKTHLLAFRRCRGRPSSVWMLKEADRASEHKGVVRGPGTRRDRQFRWHDLGHTWASWHVQNGTPLSALQELGGWASTEMVRRCAHLAAEHLAPYAERLVALRAIATEVDGTKRHR